MTARLLLTLLLSLIAAPAAAQSVLERSPNLHGVWGLESGRAAFVFAHRFEFISGGDQLFSVPTFTLAVGLPLGLTAGTDFTTFSEAIEDKVTENESQFWLKRPVNLPAGMDAAMLVGYNTAASSADGAIDLRYAANRFQLFAEGRAFSSLFGSGDFEVGAAVGAAIRLTEHLSVTGDIGQILTLDGVPAAWSAALAAEIPGAPHTLSLQVANSGAVTLHGASREKTVGSSDLRYGFSFTVPLGSPARWARLFRPVTPTQPTVAGARLVQIRQFDYLPREIVIRSGETVEWINVDPVGHTATADDGSWDSEYLEDGQRYSRTFTEPGRYTYYCVPHPDMRGTVVVR
jgi:plastocyanin